MIEKLLVANRGEIARRVMRSAHAMGIACVAVFSDPDSSAPHVLEADEAVRLPGERAQDTYLDAEALVEAAARSGAGAVHPGYGFLSESAHFARACERAGLVWVGPPSDVIEAMGSKIAAKQAMARAGVPVLPSVEVSTVRTDGRLDEGVAQLGWPVLVKASAGGGGRGMRVVHAASELEDALSSAQREARAAFGDPTLFIEPYVVRPRHIEVQVLGDSHGTIVHLFERECSIQRRHQKIVEEAPSPSVDEELREELGAAALRAARAVGYVNAGTVEFLLLEDSSFAFLEMNTRLQVEHTVTECVTGLDLVRLQLLVADGAALPREVLEAHLQGHAIEARLYAEDPTASYRPSPGRVHRFRTPVPGHSGDISLRVERGAEDGCEISIHYDPLLAKLVTHAPSRAEASLALSRALQITEVHGPRTNRDLLVRVLRHPEFVAGDFDTGFLERHDPAHLGAPLAGPEEREIHAAAAALAASAHRRADAAVLRPMPSGWRNVPTEPQRCSYESDDGEIEVAYRLGRGGRLETLELDGKPRDDLELESCSETEVVLRCAGVLRRYRVHLVGREAYVDGPDGSSALGEVERFPLPRTSSEPGALNAPLPGTVTKLDAGVGRRVSAGDVLVCIEAMKMEHEIRSHQDGVVSAVNVSPGQQVDAGTVLVVVEALGDPKALAGQESGAEWPGSGGEAT